VLYKFGDYNQDDNAVMLCRAKKVQHNDRIILYSTLQRKLYKVQFKIYNPSHYKELPLVVVHIWTNKAHFESLSKALLSI